LKKQEPENVDEGDKYEQPAKKFLKKKKLFLLQPVRLKKISHKGTEEKS